MLAEEVAQVALFWCRSRVSWKPIAMSSNLMEAVEESVRLATTVVMAVAA